MRHQLFFGSWDRYCTTPVSWEFPVTDWVSQAVKQAIRKSHYKVIHWEVQVHRKALICDCWQVVTVMLLSCWLWHTDKFYNNHNRYANTHTAATDCIDLWATCQIRAGKQGVTRKWKTHMNTLIHGWNQRLIDMSCSFLEKSKCYTELKRSQLSECFFYFLHHLFVFIVSRW